MCITLFLLLSMAGYAQEKININGNGLENKPEVSLEEKKGAPFFAQAKRARPFDLNPAVANPGPITKGTKLQLQLFRDKDFSSTVVRKITDVNNVTTLTLKLDEFDYSFAYITTSEGSYLLTVDIPELKEKYSTRRDKTGKGNFLFLLDPEKLNILEDCSSPKNAEKRNPGNSEKDSPVEDQDLDNFNPVESESNQLDKFTCEEEIIEGEIVIDLMLIYTPAAKEWADANNDGIENTIATAIASANNVSANSSLGINFNLVYSGLVEYNETSGGTSLSEMTDQDDGILDEVHALRATVGADMVAMFNLISDVGGVAWLLNDANGDKNSAFSVTRVQQASDSYTFIHELGHNMGIGHNKDQKVQPGNTNWKNWPENTWSGGWRWEASDSNLYCDVMSYPGGNYYDDGRYSIRIPNFSDPQFIHLGAAAGDPVEGDGARTIRVMRNVIGKYSEEKDACKAQGNNMGVLYIENVSIQEVNNNTGISLYSNYFGIPFCISKQEINEVKVDVGGHITGKRIAAWVDWDNDGIFDPEKEKLDVPDEDLTSYNFSITAPVNTSMGRKRLRIRSYDKENDPVITPCGLTKNGEVEDYALNVQASTACEAATTPLGGNISGIEGSKITYSWTPVPGVGSYEVEYRKSGDEIWSLKREIFLPYVELDGLESTTTYEVRVRSICEGSLSDFSELLQFTTTGVPNALRFTGVPLHGETGNSLDNVTLEFQDLGGNKISSSGSVTISLLDLDNSGGILSGVKTLSAKEGIVTFKDLRIDQIGRYRLLATVDALPEVTSEIITLEPYQPKTYVVNTTLDNPDADLSDNICADLEGNCSLRAAIENANKSRGKDKIHFNIPSIDSPVIRLSDGLPIITNPVVLDGTTQQNYSFTNHQVVIDGSNIAGVSEVDGEYGFGLMGNSSGSVIKGFTMGGFNNGLYTMAIFLKNTNDHLIEGNKIGTSVDGMTANPNYDGVYLDNSSGNTIGGAGESDGNLFGGNGRAISLDNAHNNNITNNFFGTNINGNDTIKNRFGIWTGIDRRKVINNDQPYSSHNNIVNNLISGSTAAGLVLSGTENTVKNNLIGTDVTGKYSLPNIDGMRIHLGGSNFVGEVGAGNLISGNETGIRIYYSKNNIISSNKIGTDLEGNAPLPNATGINLLGGEQQQYYGGNRIQNNTISGNLDEGIFLESSNDIIVQNFIGSNAAGTLAIPNRNGIQVFNGTYNIIGEPERGNVISGNSEYGIWINNGAYNRILNNNLGTQTDRTSPLPNGVAGIVLNGSFQEIGGVGSGNSNLIAYHSQAGIILNSGYGRYNRIFENKFLQNSIGIDLGNDGISRNDRLDSDNGPNNLQNYPELSEGATMESGSLTLNYLLPSDPGYSAFPLTVELFKSDGNRQGVEYLGSDVYTENDIPKGKKTKAVIIGLPSGSSLISGDKVTAIATDAEGNTSEFSAEVQVTGDCEVQIWYVDADMDGYGIDSAETNISSCTKPEGHYVTRAGDCDDTDAEIHPEAEDIPDDGIDQNCDGVDATNVIVDSDNDGVADSEDNCPEVANSDQADANGNGIGDACESTACLGTDVLNLSDCTSGSLVYWTVKNPGGCAVEVRWEVRKGSESGAFSLNPGESNEFTTAVVSKGQTQVIVYWNDSTGTEVKMQSNASGTSCAMAATISEDQSYASEEVPFAYPNPVESNGFYISFSEGFGEKSFDAAIYDLNSRLIEHGSFMVPSGGGNIYWNVNTESWNSGVYILKLESNTESYQLNLIKE